MRFCYENYVFGFGQYWVPIVTLPRIFKTVDLAQFTLHGVCAQQFCNDGFLKSDFCFLRCDLNENITDHDSAHDHVQRIGGLTGAADSKLPTLFND